MIVLDSDVVSELMKIRPELLVAARVRGRARTELYATAVTGAEVRFGIRRLPRGIGRNRLTAAVDDVLAAIAAFILPFHATAAVAYADVVNMRERAGAPMSAFDGQIATICRTPDAGLATRNTRGSARG